ncbi:MAG: Type 1 glutamine amidotransferase-like domain-containing protein [Cyanobacteria bacterium J06639_14]
MIKQNHRLVRRITIGFGITTSILFQASNAYAGSLVLTGGSWAFPGSGGVEEDYGISIYEEIVDLSGGIDNAKIGIISTASSNPERSAGFYLEDFDILYGDAADVEWIPITRDTCSSFKNDSDSAIANQIRDRNSFIFTGGDQSFISECFFNEDPVAETRTDTALIEALREQFDDGAVIAGTSAGTAVQPVDPMITNGETYEALRDGPVSFVGSPPFDNTLYYNPLGGLGFFEYGLIDSHFSERGRQGRTMRLASDLGVETAYGVDENTALVITEVGTPEVNFEVLGQGGVFISDVSEATVGEKNGYWTIEGVNATYLTEGDQYNPLTKTASFGEKSPIIEESEALPVIDNIFSYFDDDLGDWTDQRVFTETGIELFRSTADTAFGQSFEDDPTYGVQFTKTSNSQGFSGLDSQGFTKSSFENLKIDIAPVPEPGTVLGLVTLGAFGIGSRLKRKRV